MAPPLEVMIPAISWELNNLVSNINRYSFILVLLNLSKKNLVCKLHESAFSKPRNDHSLSNRFIFFDAETLVTLLLLYLLPVLYA